MAPVTIKFAVSFSSQDKHHKVSNVLEDSSSAKRWLTDPRDRSGQIDAIFQLDRPCQLAYIDIGVIWCGSIEVRVGKSDWPQGQSYVTLVPTQVLMSSVDARLSRNFSRTCMFTKAHFTQEGADSLQSWDRIQVVGLQPWRKDVQLGLSFIRVRSHDSLDTAPNGCKVAASDAGSGLRNALSVKDMEQHFFGNKKDEKREDTELKNRLQKIAATAEGVTVNPNILSRNARMVLLANQNCAKPASPDENCATQDSVPVDSEQEPVSVRSEEVMSFLGTLGIGKEDIESLKVSDLRHKFEKLKWRKLSSDEKRTFYNCCQDFIGRLFDEETGDVSTTDSTTTNHTRLSDCSPRHDDKYRNAAKKAGDISKHSSDSKHRVLTSKEGSRDHGHTTPKASVQRTVNAVKASGDGKSPRSDQRLSGGFLTSVYSIHKDRQDVTPNKTASTNKSQDDSNHKTNIPRSRWLTDGNLSSTPKHTTSTVLPSVSNNLSERQISPVRHFGKSRTGDLDVHADELYSESKNSSPQNLNLHDKHSSPRPNEFIPTSKINKSLLNTHRQFVKSRLQNVSMSRSSKPGPPSTVIKSSVDDDLSGELNSPAESSSEFSHHRQTFSGKGSQKLGKKRHGSPVSSLENINPAKQRPKYCSTPKGQEDVSSDAEEDGGWLNARRDAGRSNLRRGGGISGKQQGGRSRTKDLESSPLAGSSTGSRVEGGRGGRGGGAVAARRQLQMPVESSASVTPTPATSTDVDSDDPFVGELQIDEDVAFVECPMCAEMFPSDTVNTHAADCPGKEAGGQGTRIVQCPLCEDMYSEDVIVEHASRCCL